MPAWIDELGTGYSIGENTPDWFNTANPLATLDPDREFGVNLIDSDAPEDSVLTDHSQDWQNLNEDIENTEEALDQNINNVVGAGLDIGDYIITAADPNQDAGPWLPTPDWVDWILDYQEEVAIGLVVLVVLWLARPYAGIADSAT